MESDAAVVKRVLNGEVEAYSILVERYFDHYVRFAVHLVGNREDAEEVVQDTFLRAYRALVAYPPERVRELKQKAWLHRIALNVVRNRVRGRRPRLVELDGSEPDARSGPEEDALRRMELDELACRVASLPARYRDALVLRHVQELSYEEAAGALGQPVGTVKSNVHRGLKLLRGEDHGDPDE